jgi:hypothetical protein
MLENNVFSYKFWHICVLERNLGGSWGELGGSWGEKESPHVELDCSAHPVLWQPFLPPVIIQGLLLSNSLGTEHPRIWAYRWEVRFELPAA